MLASLATPQNPALEVQGEVVYGDISRSTVGRCFNPDLATVL